MLNFVDKPQIFEYLSKSVNLTIYDCKWIPLSARFIILGSYPKSTGAIHVYEVESSELKLQTHVEKASSFKCGTFKASETNERYLATGDFEGKFALWDLEQLTTPISELKAHVGIVNTMDGCKGNGQEHCPREIATGGRDGCVKVYDIRQQPLLVASFEPAKGSKTRECWSVAFGNSFNDSERCLLAGYDNGDVKLFDLRMNKIRWEENVKNGVCGVQFDRQDIEMNKFIVTCLESQFHVYDARTQHTEKGFAKYTHLSEFNSTCWAGYHLPQNREICAVTHGDGTIAIFKYHYPSQRSIKDKDGKSIGVAGHMEQLSYCNLTTQPLTCFDWNSEKEGLFVCGALDQQIRIGCVTKLNKI